MTKPSIRVVTADIPDDVEHEKYALNELGLSRRLVDKYKYKIRYCHELKSWFVYDGCRWSRDTTGQIMRYARKVVQSIARLAEQTRDNTNRKRLKSYVRRISSVRMLKNMLELAQSEPELAVKADDFDQTSQMVCVENGCIDFNLGFRKNDPKDMHTKVAPVHFDPKARHSVWKRFIDDLTGNDGVLAAFLSRVFGYALLGSCVEEKIFFICGEGAAGKSTFIESIKAALGNYVKIADFNTLLKKGNSNTSHDIARLKGARIVVINEIEPNVEISAKTIKSLTGRDHIVSRNLYENATEWVPEFTIFVICNHLPKFNTIDSSIERRVVVIELNNVVPKEKRDPALKTQLCSDELVRSEILNFLISGSLLHLREKLVVPLSVRQATNRYLNNQDDPVGEWIEECCVEMVSSWTATQWLYKSYMSFCEEKSTSPISLPLFSRSLKQRGYSQATRRLNGKATRGYSGIDLLF